MEREDAIKVMMRQAAALTESHEGSCVCNLCRDYDAAWEVISAPAPERPENMTDLYVACADADWDQVVGNGGPPCFHLDGARFCLRAKRWAGHENATSHRYVSLLHLIDSLRPMQDRVVLHPDKEPNGE